MKSVILRRLFKVCRNIGIDNEALHQRAYNEFGVESLKELSDVQGWYLIDVLQGKRVRRPSGRGMITDKQMYLIRQLVKELGWDDNPARLAGFIRKYAGVDSIEWLSTRAASAVIEGMKRMIRSAVPK